MRKKSYAIELTQLIPIFDNFQLRLHSMMNNRSIQYNELPIY